MMNDKDIIKILEEEKRQLKTEAMMWETRYVELKSWVETLNAERLEEAKRQQEFLYSLLIKKEGE